MLDVYIYGWFNINRYKYLSTKLLILVDYINVYLGSCHRYIYGFWRGL